MLVKYCLLRFVNNQHRARLHLLTLGRGVGVGKKGKGGVTLHELVVISGRPLLALLLPLHVHVVASCCSIVGVLQRLGHLPRHLDLLLNRRVFVFGVVVEGRVGVDLYKRKEKRAIIKISTRR